MDTVLFKFRSKRFYFYTVVAILFVVLVRPIFPPFSFPSGTIVSVSEGTSLYELAEKLRDEKVIRSPFWFRVAAILLGGEHHMKAGEYYMSQAQSTFVIAWRVFHGDYDVETVRLTIPEGFTVEKIAKLFDEKFPLFVKADFLANASEGFLFPDTYFVPITSTASSIIKLLRDNFDRRIAPFMPDIEASGHSLKEIVIMASIVENEAKTLEDREVVAGILWRRLELGAPLQVDASFAYVNGKTTQDLTLDDLKIDSPFNTYLYRGLPPQPISNPGLESIDATLHPTKTAYFYFLTGDDGKMHYSKDFDEHVDKKLKYIN